jgi:hypothetical protein
MLPLITLPPPGHHHLMIDCIRTPNRDETVEIILCFPAIVRTYYFAIEPLQNSNNESVQVNFLTLEKRA